MKGFYNTVISRLQGYVSMQSAVDKYQIRNKKSETRNSR